MGTGARDVSAAGRSAAVRLRRAAARLLPDAASLRSSRDFRSLYGGQSVSFARTMIAVVALPYQVYQLTGSALMVGLLSCAELVPLVTAAVLGGLLADAADRRRLILAAQLALIVASAALALNAARWRQVWVVFVLSAVSAGFAGLQRPSVEALVPRLVARADLPGAAALISLTANAAQVLGPLAGGSLIAADGLPAAYGLAAVSGLLGLLAFARLAPAPPLPGAGRPGPGRLREGLAYVRGRPELLGSYLIDIGAMFFGAPYALFPAYAAQFGGAAAAGLLYAAPGAGAALVSLTSGWAARVHRHGRAIVVAVCGWGAAIAAFGLAPGL